MDSIDGLSALSNLDGYTQLAQLRTGGPGGIQTMSLSGTDLPFAFAYYWPRNAQSLTTLDIRYESSLPSCVHLMPSSCLSSL